METLEATGLGYIHLGQPATTVSGGEAQRIKLATELSKRSTGKTLYVLDEPTTGLSFQDVAHLLHVLQRLTDAGNTVLVIEHHLDVIKTADYLIDLGPLGGDRGGELVATGTPEEVALHPTSYTGLYLRPLLEAAGTIDPAPAAASPGAKRPPTHGSAPVSKRGDGAAPPSSAATGTPTRHTAPPRPRSRAPLPLAEGPAATAPPAPGTDSTPASRITLPRPRSRAPLPLAEGPAATAPPSPATDSTPASRIAPPRPRSRERGPGGEGPSPEEAAATAAGVRIGLRAERESAGANTPRPITKAAEKRARQAAHPRKETDSERNLRERRERDTAPDA
jgi:hypothetical protein